MGAAFIGGWRLLKNPRSQSLIIPPPPLHQGDEGFLLYLNQLLQWDFVALMCHPILKTDLFLK